MKTEKIITENIVVQLWFIFPSDFEILTHNKPPKSTKYMPLIQSDSSNTPCMTPNKAESAKKVCCWKRSNIYNALRDGISVEFQKSSLNFDKNRNEFQIT